MAGDDPGDEIDKLLERLESGERYVQFEADVFHLKKMADNMDLVPSEIGDYRQLKLLRHCSRMAQLAPPPTIEDFEENDEVDDVPTEGAIDTLLEDEGLLGASLEYRAAAEAIVRWIHSEYDNEHSNQDYRTALRSFGRYRRKLDEPPDALDWIPTGTSNDFNPVPSERDLLDYDGDLLPLLDVCENERDAALMAVQFEAGLRGGELWDLRVGDIFDAEHSVGIHSDGKKGEKPVHLIMSVPYLQQWLTKHPAREDDQCHLWTKLNTPERPSRNTFYGYFNDAAERAGVTKAVDPTNFRKSNTRYLIKLGMSTPRIEDRQGRKRGSEHTSRYLARFGDESNEKEYARLHGIDVGDGGETLETAPVECPRCHRETPRHEDFCVFCDHALSFEATEKSEAFEDDVVEDVADVARDEPDFENLGADDIMEFRELSKEYPVIKRVLMSSVE